MTTLIDAHVHCYPSYPLDEFLRAAARNFHQNARDLNSADNYAGLLVFTEAKQEGSFQRLLNLLEKEPHDDRLPAGWRIRRTAEDASLHLKADNGISIFVLAGKQVVTSEDLEVLAIGRNCAPPLRGSLDETVKFVQEQGAIPVIPWGCGKWFQRRGRIIKALIRDRSGEMIFLGDNGNRPFFWRQSAIFSLGSAAGFANLPGSDPLPLAGEHLRPGSFGVSLSGVLEAETPYQSLRAHLRNPEKKLHPFGKAERSIKFLKNQLLMQYQKRINRA